MFTKANFYLKNYLSVSATDSSLSSGTCSFSLVRYPEILVRKCKVLENYLPPLLKPFLSQRLWLLVIFFDSQSALMLITNKFIHFSGKFIRNLTVLYWLPVYLYRLTKRMIRKISTFHDTGVQASQFTGLTHSIRF